MTKVDYHLTKHQFNGRYFFTDYDEPVVIPTDNLLAASNQAKAVRVQNVSINHTYVASPTLLFNTTFGMNRQRGGSTSTAPSVLEKRAPTSSGRKIIPRSIRRRS
jgi:hypothetical protein